MNEKTFVFHGEGGEGLEKYHCELEFHKEIVPQVGLGMVVVCPVLQLSVCGTAVEGCVLFRNRDTRRLTEGCSLC